MIWELLLGAVAFLLEVVWGILTFGFPSPPSWFIAATAQASTVWAWVDGFQTWLPISLTMQVAAAVIGAWLASLVIGVVKAVVSHMTFGGGS